MIAGKKNTGSARSGAAFIGDLHFDLGIRGRVRMLATSWPMHASYRIGPFVIGGSNKGGCQDTARIPRQKRKARPRPTAGKSTSVDLLES